MTPTSLSGPRLGLFAGLIGYGVILFVLIGAVAGGSDNSGYFNEARLFSRGVMRAPMRTVEGVSAGDAAYLYVPLGFKPAVGTADQMVPTYPPGLPLMLAAVAPITGWDHAGDVVLIIHSLAGLALVFALGRICGLPGSWSLAGAAVLAASPLYLYTSLQALSDVPATVWATAAVVAALKSRERNAWALASGLCISVGFMVRPNNFLIAVPIIVAVGLSPRRLFLVALGSLPGIAAWMGINHAAYGSALESGYGAIGNEFHAALIPGTLAYIVRWLPLLLSPLVIFAPSILAFAPSVPRVTWVLGSWAVAYIAFFSAYRWTHEQWWFLRFLLPAAPALIVAGLIVPRLWFERVSRGRPGGMVALLPVLLVIAAIGVELGQTGPFREARAIGHGERKYGRVADWLNAHAPGNSAIVMSQVSGALYYFTNFTLLRYDELNPQLYHRIRDSLQSGGRPLYAVLFPFEEGKLGNLPGAWERVAKVDDVSIWRCDLSQPSK